jgi:hypothetical protein
MTPTRRAASGYSASSLGSRASLFRDSDELVVGWPPSSGHQSALVGYLPDSFCDGPYCFVRIDKVPMVSGANHGRIWPRATDIAPQPNVRFRRHSVSRRRPVYSPSTRRACSIRISSAMLVRDRRTSSANGAFVLSSHGPPPIYTAEYNGTLGSARRFVKIWSQDNFCSYVR